MKPKKPDNVAWDDEKNRWVANILPYASNVGAPPIVPLDLKDWESGNLSRAKNHIQSKYREIQDEFNKLAESYHWTSLVYSSKFSFEPIVGEVYHLYENKDGVNFLSIISPNEWEEKHIGSFRFGSNGIWEKEENV